jgi:hypothetical protein
MCHFNPIKIQDAKSLQMCFDLIFVNFVFCFALKIKISTTQWRVDKTKTLIGMNVLENVSLGLNSVKLRWSGSLFFNGLSKVVVLLLLLLLEPRICKGVGRVGHWWLLKGWAPMRVGVVDIHWSVHCPQKILSK